MTLTEVSVNVRKLLPYILISLLALLIVFYLVRLIIIFIESRKSDIVLSPTFGSIKSLEIPQASSSASFNFTLDTIEGVPTTSTAAANIYFLPPVKPRLGYREKIYLIAKSLGFDTTIVKHTLPQGSTVATFKDGSETLDIDIAYFNFSYESDFKNNSELFATSAVPDKAMAQEKAIQFLQSIDKYPAELAQGKINLIYLLFNPKDKSIAIVDDNALGRIAPNLIEVDFYRPDIDDLPAVSSSYFNSQNYVLLHYDGSDYKILRAQIKFFDKSNEHVGAYPLKTGASAYDVLKSGKGILISAPAGTKDVTVKKMFLAYFDPSQYQEYLRPVYVFLGDNNFVGYVDAVSDEFLTQ